MEKGELRKLAVVCAVTVLLIAASIPILGWSKVVSIVGETTVRVIILMAVVSIPMLVASYFYGKRSDDS